MDATAGDPGPLSRAIREHAEAQAAEYLADPEFRARLGYQRHLYETGVLHENVPPTVPYVLPPAIQRAIDLIRVVFADDDDA